MIIFHGAFNDGQLTLWGEASGEAQAGKDLKRRRKSAKSNLIERYEYDAGAGALLRGLSEIVTGLAIDESEVAPEVIWLPSVGEKAVVSSPLIADAGVEGRIVELKPFKVSALKLTTAEAVELLCLCMDREMLSPGVLIGHDLAFWASAMRFAGALTARQQYLPAIAPVEDFHRAFWEPVFNGIDGQRLARLAQAMPHSSRALTGERKSLKPPDRPAAVDLASFLTETVDYLVRQGQERGVGKPRSLKVNVESVHDRWMNALLSSDGVIEGDEAELAKLTAQAREWRRPIAVTAASPFRLCFRLEEPDKEPAWRVRYLLQAADDQSLLIPVADAWNPKGRTATALKRARFNSREYLLSALGQAAGLSGQIEESLRSAEPSGYDLDDAGAHDFLSSKAWLLEQAGFGVFLPAWWTRRGTKLRLSMRASVKSPPASKLQGVSGLSLDQIVRFDWEMALGDQTLSLKELKALADLKSSLVKVRGQWVELDAEEIQAAIAFWKKKAQGEATVRELVQMSLGKADTPGDINFEGVTATGWLGDLFARLEGRRSFEEIPAPERFRGELRPYQTRGYSWLAFLRHWGLGACLADDMGLGKTVQALALIEREWESDGGRPTLLVCPTSVLGNWQREAARFTPDLPVMMHHGLTRAKGAAFKKAAAKHAIVVSSYSLLQRDFEILKDVEWAGVILDEAQNIKNPETKQARAARAIRANFKIALTGTPVENNVGDLWSLMEFLNPGLLGTQAEFKRKFFIPIQAQRDEAAARKLKRLTGPFILRRLKTDKSVIDDLPEKNEMKIFCNLTKEQASLYAAVVKDASESLDEAAGIQRKGVVLATLSKLKQVCNHPAQFLGDNSAIPGRSGKLARLTEMLEEAIAAGDRALIFSQFSEMGGVIQRHLQESFGREALFLHGGTPKKERDRMVERFQKSDGQAPRFFVLSLKAGGTGLNLTAANHVFHYDRWWNPAVENQATDRAFRIGQRRNVQVHKFLCAGTLEEKIDDMIERKKEIASSIVGTGESWLTELSTGELKELFALREDAVGE